MVRERGAVGKLGKAMNWYSQAGQDRFVHAVLGGKGSADMGTFLDIGCSDPVLLSNTYALEQLGWRGVLIDCAPQLAARIADKRRSPFICAKAETLVWPTVLKRLPHLIDYLSFDVDGAALHEFDAFPWAHVRFRVLTVEHDAYRFGDGPRAKMRAGLAGQGYELLCPNVMNDGLPYEDWWIDPREVDMTVAERFRTAAATAWIDIVSR